MSSIITNILEEESKAIGLSITASELISFEKYAAELLKWNSKFNLTSIKKYEEIAVKHFIDSLTIAPYLSQDDRLLDIGSGAGLPIIPLKIIMPNLPMISVDAVAKKIHFQRHIIRILNLQNIEAIHTRIEELHKTERDLFSVITSRAFTRLDRFVDLASPLLAKGGLLIAMKGEKADDEISQSDETLHATGFIVDSVHRYSLPQNMGKRVLTFLKRRETL